MRKGPGGGEPSATVMLAVEAVVRALNLKSGRITVVVQHPGTIAYLDVNHRYQPEALANVSISGGQA